MALYPLTAAVALLAWLRRLKPGTHLFRSCRQAVFHQYLPSFRFLELDGVEYNLGAGSRHGHGAFFRGRETIPTHCPGDASLSYLTPTRPLWKKWGLSGADIAGMADR
jgi:hypothetical protein